ncbi:hypothetical protein RFN28_15550 [Mesorhizobium sp. VK24D]|uniref:Uncharacterized protein n=1 Tax=Mesorhizobium album TaxID=3072314 RepID=A0ABU4XZN9_9HYPH|nr:hypothetical protein [Mesorhizobium sp. VK24D]
MNISRNLTLGTSLTASNQLVACAIAPSGIYAVLVIALALISRSARRASAGHLASASFIDIHDAAGLPFLIVVPAIEPSSTARAPQAKALDAKAQKSAGPAMPMRSRS